MQLVGIRTGIVVAGILSWPGPLNAAGQTDQRMIPLTGAISPLSPEDGAAMAAIDAPLSQVDRQLVDGMRTRTYVSAIEPIDLAISMSRFRGGRPDNTHFDTASDRFSGQAAGMTLNLPVTSSLTLQPNLSLTRIKRHLVTIADIFRPRTTLASSLGLALVDAAGPTLRLDWVQAAPQGTRAPFERMAELMGGAPAAARGLRLSLLANGDGGRNSVQWSLRLSSLQRARADSAFANVSGYVPEKRAEVSLKFAF